MKLPQSFTWYEFNQSRPFSLESVQEELSHLALFTPRGFIAFEIRSCSGRITYLIGMEKKYSGKIKELFRGHGDVEFTEIPEGFRKPVSLARYLSVSKPVLSLNVGVTSSTIRAGLAAMSAVKRGDQAVLQVVMGRGYAPHYIPPKMQDPHESWLDLALSGVRQATPDSVKSAKEKAGECNVQAIIRIGATGDTAEGRIDNIVSTFRVLQSAGVRIRDFPEKPNRLNEVYIHWQIPLRLSVKELAPFLLLPVGEENLPGVAGLHPKKILPPAWYKPPMTAASDRSFAKSLNANGKSLSISPASSLEHTIILGPTGAGKSTVMEHLILADIKAGRSVLVLDPKADLVTDIMERMPKERWQDVVVIDPSDACPVGFNPLRFKRYKNKALIADATLSVLKEIFADSWGIRTQQILSAALLTLTEVPNSNLLWLPSLLTEESFRRRILQNVNDRIGLLPFWRQFEAMKDSERNACIAPVLNKMQQFVFRPGLRNVLGQSNPKFDLMDLFLKRKIVLVPLNRGIIGGESARLLGSLIVGLTWTLALSRANVPKEKRHLVSVFIDELQDYLSLPTDLADALAQARGLGVGMTLAHQYRGQLPPDIRAAIDANARNKIVFGLNGTDAKDMKNQAPELSQEDFMFLPRYQIYANIIQNKKNTGWISGITLPSSPPINLAAEVKAESMKAYGKPAEEIEAELLRMLEPETKTAENEESQPTDGGVGRVGRRKT